MRISLAFSHHENENLSGFYFVELVSRASESEYLHFSNLFLHRLLLIVVSTSAVMEDSSLEWRGSWTHESRSANEFGFWKGRL
jgi:hypothetical protein